MTTEKEGRRRFMKNLWTVPVLALFPRRLRAGSDAAAGNAAEKESRCAEEMRPGEIVESLARNSFAFVPVSPMLEWHSLHLPMGTDGLICEAFCRMLAERHGGIWFRPLAFGLDALRTPEQKKMWGIPESETVFGMDFPHFPVKSEYCRPAEMKAAVTNRVESLRRTGVKRVFLINHHGGAGQFDLISGLARDLSDEKTAVHGLTTYRFNDLTEADGWTGIGGHAGFAETLWLTAFRPELADTTLLPEGELGVNRYGILHDNPVIEARWNPRRIDPKVAAKLRMTVMRNFDRFLADL
jgi:creatinine amidohydrolase/Fe(II)-dependent formamide hydrolase-like protein